MIRILLSATARLWKPGKIEALGGKTGQNFPILVVRNYGKTTNGGMKNEKCRIIVKR